jgi:hypothetical protein
MHTDFVLDALEQALYARQTTIGNSPNKPNQRLVL